MKNGKVIVIEGADGVGKSTQLSLLFDRLQKDGISVIDHHFPSYKTYHGALVEHYLKGDYGDAEKLSPYFVNSLYAVDRAVVWETFLKKFFENDFTILLDRYTTSSLIYQSAFIEDIQKKKEFLNYVADFEYNKLGLSVPDSVIFLTAPFDIITNNRNMRADNDGVKNDLHERNINLMKKVYDNSLFVANYFSWDLVNCSKDGSFRSIEDIHEEVYSLVKKI